MAAGTGTELTLEQVVAAVGVLKRHLLETAQLETSFTLLCSNPRSLQKTHHGSADKWSGERPRRSKLGRKVAELERKASRASTSPSKRDAWHEEGDADGGGADGDGDFTPLQEFKTRVRGKAEALPIG